MGVTVRFRETAGVVTIGVMLARLLVWISIVGIATIVGWLVFWPMPRPTEFEFAPTSTDRHVQPAETTEGNWVGRDEYRAPPFDDPAPASITSSEEVDVEGSVTVLDRLGSERLFGNGAFSAVFWRDATSWSGGSVPVIEGGFRLRMPSDTRLEIRDLEIDGSKAFTKRRRIAPSADHRIAALAWWAADAWWVGK